MLLAYIDEFGHIGPYIAPDHPKHNNHPVYGYGGFVIPARSMRLFGGTFEYIKSKLLAYEIARDGAHPRRWEKKGAALLTTQNMERYGTEIRGALGRLSRALEAGSGRSFFYGQVKPTGSALETGESSRSRTQHTMRQSLLRLAQFAHRQQQELMVFVDSVDSAPRLEAVASMGGFIYSAHDPALRRIVDIPVQVESHLYGGVQYADWLCALYSRATHGQMVEGSEFYWAPREFARTVSGICTPQSRIWNPATSTAVRASDIRS